VVTNYHVIEDAAAVVVEFEDGRKDHSEGYLAADKANDLALLKCDTGTIKPLPLGGLPDKLDPVYAIGSPRGLSGTISNGIVSGFAKRNATGSVLIQTTAPISPGSSGGPLLNENGEVIGVTTEAFRDSQNLNFAVAALHVAALETVAEKIARPWGNLPLSAGAKRRAELRRLEFSVKEAAKGAADAINKLDQTWDIYLNA
jgi:S1-C subfamily serine protease